MLTVTHRDFDLATPTPRRPAGATARRPGALAQLAFVLLLIDLAAGTAAIAHALLRG